MPGQGRVGDISQVGALAPPPEMGPPPPPIPADMHGSVCCPHPALGPGISGSPDTLVNNLPALRVGDPGLHAACCGTNTWTAKAGSATVFINGKKAHRKGDAVKHCGGDGMLITGSSNVLVGG